MLIAAGGHTHDTVSSMEQKTTTIPKIVIFIIRKQNSSFGNSYYNLDFLTITKKFGRVGSYETDRQTDRQTDVPLPGRLGALSLTLKFTQTEISFLNTLV